MLPWVSLRRAIQRSLSPKKKLMDTIYLGVDAENERALELYKSLDFKVYKESIHYKRAL